ncbi:MAG: acyl carrier protein [Coleofasciculus sp. S288]|nr:acyl carrier protein [Coleofasciculus sp. S288]
METLEAIKQESHQIVLDILPNVTSEELLDNSDIFSLGLDSINAMMLVMNLQDAFGVMFETSEISVDNFRTIKNIVDLIAKKKGVSMPVY